MDSVSGPRSPGDAYLKYFYLIAGRVLKLNLLQ